MIWSFDKQVFFAPYLFSFVLLDSTLSQATDLYFHKHLCVPTLKPYPMHFVWYHGEYPEDRVKPEERYSAWSVDQLFFVS